MRTAAHSHLQGVQQFWRRTHTMVASHNVNKEQSGRVLVYTGEGAGSRSVASTVESLRSNLTPDVEVVPVGPEEVVAGGWSDKCLLLVMPGGADLPYCRQLNGPGTASIQGYVEDGGAYLGLCAGAYFACDFVEFALGTRLEVKGPRELAFFPGVAAGPVYDGFRYESEAGAHAAAIAFRPPSSVGGTAGAAHGATAEAHSLGGQDTDGEHPGSWRRCRDYTNGGPAFLPYSSSSSGGAHAFEALAVYTEKEDALAAVRCSVGRGVAVLVGTHPELDTRWLCAAPDIVPAVDSSLKTRGTCPETDSDGERSGWNGAPDAGSKPSTQDSVREQLERCARDRRMFLRALLQAAGLAQHLEKDMTCTGQLDIVAIEYPMV